MQWFVVDYQFWLHKPILVGQILFLSMSISVYYSYSSWNHFKNRFLEVGWNLTWYKPLCCWAPWADPPWGKCCVRRRWSSGWGAGSYPGTRPCELDLGSRPLDDARTWGSHLWTAASSAWLEIQKEKADEVTVVHQSNSNLGSSHLFMDKGCECHILLFPSRGSGSCSCFIMKSKIKESCWKDYRWINWIWVIFCFLSLR